jgi:hypothetical protein
LEFVIPRFVEHVEEEETLDEENEVPMEQADTPLVVH